MMDRCFALLLDEVHRYEGTVNQFTGDGIMAIFGAPVALEDAPRRAVLAALGIQRALAPLREELAAAHGVDFRMRIGIHTGVVVVGRIGNDLRMDYTAVGDTTNLAARLQAAAPAGGVLVSEATARLVAGFFETRDLGELPLKGISGSRRAFEVLAEREGGGRLGALADAALTPLAGRERELALLAEAFASARDGRGRVVVPGGRGGHRQVAAALRVPPPSRRRAAPRTSRAAALRTARTRPSSRSSTRSGASTPSRIATTRRPPSRRSTRA